MGIPYMSTEQVERLAHLIDTSGRGKITYKDFAAKFRPGQLKFGWLEEALKVIGRSFTTKRRGGQVEKDADKVVSITTGTKPSPCEAVIS